MSAQIIETHFQFPDQTGVYHGKVRDVYEIRSKYLVMVASDRISAFDVILPRPIPHKGTILNQIASYNLKQCRDICPNWWLSSPDPNVTIGFKCEPIRIEMVIRAYLTGHAWRVYASGAREICGIPLPDGLNEHDKLPEPIITPASKAAHGHDEDISRADILRLGLVTEREWNTLERYTRDLFERGTALAAQQGLILVDTKYEFGRLNGLLYLMDEVHTPDSSRYFYANGYQERQLKREPQKQLSKEFVREWLMSEGFQGKEGQQIPPMTDDVVDHISGRYIELYQQLMGRKFTPPDTSNTLQRIEQHVLEGLQQLPD